MLGDTSIHILAGMPNHGPTLRAFRRAMGPNRGNAPWSARRSRRPWPQQSAVRQRGDLDCSKRGALARLARAIRPMEHGISAVQPLVQVRRMGTGLPGIAGSRPGGIDARLDREKGSSARGGRRPQKGSAGEDLGRSRGGFSTKLHVAVDAKGQPLELRLGPGEEHDIVRAEELLAEHQPEFVIADKGYDADELVEKLRRRGAKPVIPSRSNRKRPRPYNRRLYRSRNLIERFVNRIKHYRRVATRYEKTARNFLAFVHLAASLVTMGATVNIT